MNEAELKNIWQSYDKKLDQLLEVNFRQLKALQSEKAESKIRAFKRSHIVVALFGIAWILFLGFLVYHTLSNIYFTISVSLIILFNVFAVIAYFRHIVILQQVNISENIIETQRKLALVITSDRLVGRILLLQTPFYCTFYYNDQMVQHAGLLFWVIQFVITTLLTLLSIYLFIKLSPNHTSANFLVRFFDKQFSSEKLQKASLFLSEIEKFKKERE